MPSVLDFLTGGVLPGVKGILDSVLKPGEDKTVAMTRLAELETGLQAQAMSIDAALTTAQADVIIAEAKGESWLQRNWRPIASLSLVALLGWVAFSSSLHLPPPDFAAVPDQLWSTIKLCVGGYVGLRSGEKIVTSFVDASLAKRQSDNEVPK